MKKIILILGICLLFLFVGCTENKPICKEVEICYNWEEIDGTVNPGQMLQYITNGSGNTYDNDNSTYTIMLECLVQRTETKCS